MGTLVYEIAVHINVIMAHGRFLSKEKYIQGKMVYQNLII